MNSLASRTRSIRHGHAQHKTPVRHFCPIGRSESMVFMATSLPGPISGLRYLLSSRRLSFGGEDASIQTAGCPWALVLLAHKKKKKSHAYQWSLLPRRFTGLPFPLDRSRLPKSPITGFASTVRYVFITIDDYRGVNHRPSHCGSYLEKLHRYRSSL